MAKEQWQITKGGPAIRRRTMASNFRIYCHQNKGNLHLKLVGDFDGSSAYELINTLKKYRGIVGKVFIHTCFLSSVCSFGLDVFQKSYTIKKLSRILTFTGKYGNKLAPRGSVFLKPKSEVFYDSDNRYHLKKVQEQSTDPR
jgi:hypothetical protein